MCFSAGASFGASAVIGAISVACFVKAKEPAQKVWACIPLFFSVQQAIEGVLWLSLTHQGLKGLYLPGVYGFLLFAQVVWPVMIPVAAFIPEPDVRRRKLLKVFLCIGAGVAALHLVTLLCYDAQVTIREHQIHYDTGKPKLLLIAGNIIYFIAAVPPLLFSSLKYVKWMGVALVLTYILSWIFYRENIVSVWCYLAAVLSSYVYWIIIQMGKTKECKEYRT